MISLVMLEWMVLNLVVLVALAVLAVLVALKTFLVHSLAVALVMEEVVVNPLVLEKEMIALCKCVLNLWMPSLEKVNRLL